MPNTPSGGREHEDFTTESTIVVRKSRNMTVITLELGFVKFSVSEIVNITEIFDLTEFSLDSIISKYISQRFGEPHFVDDITEVLLFYKTEFQLYYRLPL